MDDLELAQLQAHLTTLREARYTGAKLVRHGSGNSSREIEFRSDAELAAAIADVERRIAAPSARRVTTVRVSTSKGFGS